MTFRYMSEVDISLKLVSGGDKLIRRIPRFPNAPPGTTGLACKIETVEYATHQLPSSQLFGWNVCVCEILIINTEDTHTHPARSQLHLLTVVRKVHPPNSKHRPQGRRSYFKPETSSQYSQKALIKTMAFFDR